MTTTVRSHREATRIVKDYFLDDVRLSVIIPIERTNLILGPSFETNTTDYTAVDGAILTRTTEDQRRGAYALKVKPGLSSISGLYYTSPSLTSGNTYAFSLDVNVRGGRKYQIRVSDNARNLVTKKVIGKGFWERVSVVFTAVTTGVHRIYFEKDDNTNTDAFFTDGWQLELCEAGNFWPTTYIDGDQSGFVANQTAYYWNGAAHASSSTRIAGTRAGGREMNLKDFGFRVLAIIGLGFAPLVNVATPYGLMDGSYYQRTVVKARTFSVVGQINGSTLQEMNLFRQSLVDAIQPDAAGIRQPLVLQYQQMNRRGEAIGETLEIVASYSSGLDGIFDNFNQEKITLQFTAFDPYLSDVGCRGATLSFSSDVTNANKVVKLSKQSGWSSIIGGFSGLGNVDALLYHNGVLYAGSTVSSGDLNIFNFANNTRTVISTFDGAIHALAPSPDGTQIYISGNFTSVAGVTSPGLVAYNVSSGTFTSLNSAIAGVGDVAAGGGLLDVHFADAGGDAA